MKRKKRSKVLFGGVVLIFFGLLIPAISFLFDPFGASFYYAIFLGGSLIWLSIVAMDVRTHLHIFTGKYLHPQLNYASDVAIITYPRTARFYRFSSAIFVCLSFGLAPWLFPGVFLPGSTYPSLWHLFTAVTLLPIVVYLLILSIMPHTITVNRRYIKQEVTGLWWRSTLISDNPNLDIDVHKQDNAIEFIISNATYTRRSFFGTKTKHLEQKRIPIPETRNVPIDEFLSGLFPEQQHIIPLMIDLLHEPRYNEWHRTDTAQKIRDEITQKQQELHNTKNTEQ